MEISSWMKSLFNNQNKPYEGGSNSKKSTRKQAGFLLEQRYISDRLKDFVDEFLTEWEKISQTIQDESLNPITKQNLITQRQNQLNQVLMRAQTGLRRSTKLQQERTEWQRRMSEPAPCNLHHPAIRFEILESELKTRDMLAGNLPEPVKTSEAVYFQPKNDEQEEVAENTKPAGIVYVGLDSANYLDIPTSGLIRQIKDISKEIALHHHSPDGDSNEMLDFAHQLKQMHAVLKKQDRKNGTNRDRIALTDGFAHVFTFH